MNRKKADKRQIAGAMAAIADRGEGRQANFKPLPEKQPIPQKSPVREPVKKENSVTPKKKKKTKEEKEAERQIRSVLSVFPVRRYVEYGLQEEGYFLLDDGSLLDIFQLKGRSYENAAEDELEAMVNQSTYFYRRYKGDFKLVFLNYPANTMNQQKYLEAKLDCADNSMCREMMETKLQTLHWLSENTSGRQAFFLLFARGHSQYAEQKELLFSYSGFHPVRIPQQTKERILWQLNNMSKKIRL